MLYHSPKARVSPVPDTILITGGTGTTGRRVAAQLSNRAIHYRVATRSPKGPSNVHFDWTESATWAPALKDVTRIYLVAPSGVAEPLPVMIPFMELAIQSGVKRFVLLSASSLEAGGPMMGAVHTWLRDHSAEWVVLRPTWFMQNFSEGQLLAPIREDRAIYTATGDGWIGFIDADDIATVAVEALTQTTCVSGDIILTGPQALSYDDVANTLSTVLDQTIRHHHLSAAELVARHMQHANLPKAYTQTLAQMDSNIAAGSEYRTTDAVLHMTGRPPRALKDFVAANADVWRSE